MEIRKIGTRIEIDREEHNCVISARSGSPRLSAAAITRRPNQPPQIAVAQGSTEWNLSIPNEPNAQTDIVLYMTSDIEMGKVEDRDAIVCKVGNFGFALEPRQDKHGAVILAQIYTKNGARIMRVRGDGYAFGIKALARKENVLVEPFLDHDQQSPSPMERHSPRHQNPRSRAIGSGSGIIVAPDHVITNAHVVDKGQQYVVHGPDGDHLARVLALDEEHDLALIRAPNLGGMAIAIREMGSLYLGEPIVAAGYPLRDVLGDDLKMTHGNISGMKGPRGLVSTFQFSAPIGSGSSGGAVTDLNGNLVGVVAAALSHETMRQQGAISENTNFGIKSSLVAEMLCAHGISWKPAQQSPQQNNPQMLVRIIKDSIVSITVS